jgi:hypothetical protein
VLIVVTCQCGNTFRANEQFAGNQVKCAKCGKNLVIAGKSVLPNDVFLSYSAKDKPIPDATCTLLESKKLRCWMAPRDILPGKEWSTAIIEGIELSRSLVLIFSANSNASQQVMREVERAVAKGIPIIPFRIENLAPCKALEYFISSQHWLDAFTPPLEKRLDQLATDRGRLPSRLEALCGSCSSRIGARTALVSPAAFMTAYSPILAATRSSWMWIPSPTGSISANI